ncbi:uroporphyrinogen-III C-methyltransferase [Brachybacterium hainanense]|uniref:uroporphyrinogen-III C-methyltransferase n=1 Tax=Brachybacterium hainanense TaxID=1541174 RepID=A0ABV6R8Q9_9MICO
MSGTLPDVAALSGAVLGPGQVALVGGGPGALDLITVRGLALLRQADVVIVDRLGPSTLTGLLGPDVQVIEVGKAPGRHTMQQRRIGELLVAEAEAGHRVVRLKGGDPFVLGRGGEEVLASRAAGIDVQVVPGVTSAIAGPAAGDVPVTHRGAAVATHIVNAHGDLGPADLAALRDPGTTTVLMMGVEWLPRLVAQALLAGIDADTPVAVVQEATLPGQRTVRGGIGTIVEVVRAAGIGSPAVIVVGRTAAEGFLAPPRLEEPRRGSGREALPPEPSPAARRPASGPVLIGCAHGTRSRAGRDVVRALLMRVRALRPDLPVREAYVDVQLPAVGDAVRELAAPLSEVRTREPEAPTAVVVPLLLSTGFHVAEDIGGAVAGRSAVATEPLGPDPRLAQVMAQRLAEAGLEDRDAVVMAVAGTRQAAGQTMAERMQVLLARELGREVHLGFIAAARPDVPAAIDRARAAAAPAGGRVVIAPYLLAPGFFHDQLAEAGADAVAAPLGEHPLVADVVLDRYAAALGE